MRKIVCIAFVISLLGACSGSLQDRVLDIGDQSQLQKRAYQSRVFETSDKERVMRGIISTLQDLSFLIERADLTLGSVTATKFDQGLPIRITVTVRAKGTTQMSVRANAQFNLEPIENPKSYQDLFASLEKSLYLTAHLGD